MAKPLLSAATENTLLLIAHQLMADGIAKNVEGMAEFGKFYRSKLTHSDQKIIGRFEAMCKKARQDLAHLIEQEQP